MTLFDSLSPLKILPSAILSVNPTSKNAKGVYVQEDKPEAVRVKVS
jgi:hypothetical protein